MLVQIRLHTGSRSLVVPLTSQARDGVHVSLFWMPNQLGIRRASSGALRLASVPDHAVREHRFGSTRFVGRTWHLPATAAQDEPVLAVHLGFLVSRTACPLIVTTAPLADLSTRELHGDEVALRYVVES